MSSSKLYFPLPSKLGPVLFSASSGVVFPIPTVLYSSAEPRFPKPSKGAFFKLF